MYTKARLKEILASLLGLRATVRFNDRFITMDPRVAGDGWTVRVLAVEDPNAGHRGDVVETFTIEEGLRPDKIADLVFPYVCEGLRSQIVGISSKGATEGRVFVWTEDGIETEVRDVVLKERFEEFEKGLIGQFAVLRSVR